MGLPATTSSLNSTAYQKFLNIGVLLASPEVGDVGVGLVQMVLQMSAMAAGSVPELRDKKVGDQLRRGPRAAGPGRRPRGSSRKPRAEVGSSGWPAACGRRRRARQPGLGGVAAAPRARCARRVVAGGAGLLAVADRAGGDHAVGGAAHQQHRHRRPAPSAGSPAGVAELLGGHGVRAVGDDRARRRGTTAGAADCSATVPPAEWPTSATRSRSSSPAQRSLLVALARRCGRAPRASAGVVGLVP